MGEAMWEVMLEAMLETMWVTLWWKRGRRVCVRSCDVVAVAVAMAMVVRRGEEVEMCTRGVMACQVCRRVFGVKVHVIVACIARARTVQISCPTWSIERIRHPTTPIWVTRITTATRILHTIRPAHTNAATRGVATFRPRSLSLGVWVVASVAALIGHFGAISGCRFDAFTDGVGTEAPHEAFSRFFARLVYFFESAVHGEIMPDTVLPAFCLGCCCFVGVLFEPVVDVTENHGVTVCMKECLVYELGIRLLFVD